MRNAPFYMQTTPSNGGFRRLTQREGTYQFLAQSCGIVVKAG